MLNGKSYLLDRLPFICLYFIQAAFILTVVNLGVLQRGMSIAPGDNLYVLVLSVCLLALFMGIDYARRRPFYRQIGQLRQERKGPWNLEDVLRVQSAADREEAELQQLLHDHYRANADELLRLRQREERHHTFIRQWVHQMKTPVSVIDLLLQQAAEFSSSREWREWLESLGEENERIAQGLSMILHAARLDKFEMDAAIRRIELTGFIRGIINEHKRTWIRMALYPRLTAPPHGVYAESDAKWLSFILHQFISNAIKYSALARERKGTGANAADASAEGVQAMELRFIVAEDGQGGVSLRVEDDGIGIPEQDAPRIFEPFFTGDNGRLTKESTGMGLYIAREVCLKLGHRIRVESVQGKGTAMTLLLQPYRGIHALGDAK